MPLRSSLSVGSASIIGDSDGALSVGVNKCGSFFSLWGSKKNNNRLVGVLIARADTGVKILGCKIKHTIENVGKGRAFLYPETSSDFSEESIMPSQDRLRPAGYAISVYKVVPAEST